MGIIARQSTKKTVVSFVGVVIGAISIMFIYPRAKETYGLAIFLFSFANLLMIFLSLGSLGLIVKYFPVFQRERIKGFFSLTGLITVSSIILTSMLFWLLNPLFIKVLELGDYKVDMIIDNQGIIFYLTVVIVLCLMFINHIANFKRIVVPSIFYELGYKIALPILVVLVIIGMIDQDQFKMLYLLFFTMVLVALVIYFFKLGGLRFEKIQFSRIERRLQKEMGVFMLYSALNKIGSTIVARVDTIMVATMISLTDTGIYGILLFMANVIDIPVKSINQIAAPVISSSMENDDKENVRQIYKKSSINALLIGAFIFILIWGLLPDIFYIMPESDDVLPYKNVFLFLAIGKLIDMAFSTNSHILVYSKYFRYNLFFVLLLGMVNLILNFFLIKKYGLVGAAFASAISLALYNLIKLFFIQVKLAYWPFTRRTLKLVVLVGLLFFLVGFIPGFFPGWIDIFIKGTVISLLFYLFIKLFKIDVDIIHNGEIFIKQNLHKIFSR